MRPKRDCSVLEETCPNCAIIHKLFILPSHSRHNDSPINPSVSVGTGTVTASVTLVVTQAPSTTTITSPDKTVTLGTLGKTGTASDTIRPHRGPYVSVTLTASTGEVCSGSVNSTTGNGSCKVTFTTTGPRTLTATYSGDANHTSSNNSSQNPAITVTVNP